MSKPSFVLVDGSSYLYRAFHAMPPLTNSKGQPTGAVYGFVNMLRKLLKDYQPKHVAVIFDAKGKTFRSDLYQDYKANRPPMPDELRSQIQPIHDIVNAMGLPLIVEQGVEADDVIGTLVKQASDAGLKCLVSTGDKDMAQCVNEHVSLINTMNDLLLDPKGVEEKFGIPPKLIIDYLTLIGDTSDNIPGVSKVGPKTAVKWLTEYGSLDGIIENADQIKGKVGENLREALDQIPLSKQLVTIKCDVALHEAPNQLTAKDPDNEKLIALFGELEFKSWLSELLETDEALPETHYETVLTEQQLESWIKKLKASDVFAFDTETTDLNYMNAEIVGVSFAVTTGEAAYVPLAHDYDGAPSQLDRDTVLKQLKPLLEDPKQKKLGQNLKYDMSVLANHDIHLQGIAFDTMLESYVLQSTGTRHDMDSLSLKYLGHKTIHYEEVAGKGAKQVTFNKVDIEQAAPYAAEDADVTLKLHNVLWPKLSKEPSLVSVFETIEMPLVPVLSRVERNGVLINKESLRKQSDKFAKRLQDLEQQTFDMAGEEFNLASTKQLQEVLFEKLKLPVIQKTPKGKASTSESVLQELAYDYPLPKLIMEYRTLSKLKSTYTDKLPEQVNARTGRIHTSYHQAVTATGRLSSSDPNLQNIPVRTEEGRRIRQAFIAPDGYKLIALDYSQIELRIMAHISGDKALVKAFKNGWDIHTATASEVFGVEPDKVTADHRRHAKAINFGLIYGMSAFGLAKQIGTDRTSAQEYIDIYFARYPDVKNYMDDIKAKAHKQGYVETIFGRRLYLPEINAANKMRQLAAERTAINGPMQGTAADIIKKAMINADNWLQNSKVDAKMIMQVHDELVFEVAESDVEECFKQIKHFMEHAAELTVDLIVDDGIGNNWDEAH